MKCQKQIFFYKKNPIKPTRDCRKGCEQLDKNGGTCRGCCVGHDQVSWHNVTPRVIRCGSDGWLSPEPLVQCPYPYFFFGTPTKSAAFFVFVKRPKCPYRLPATGYRPPAQRVRGLWWRLIIPGLFFFGE